MRKTFFITAIIWFSIVAFASAQEEKRLEAQLEMNHTSIGNPLYLYVTFHGSQNVQQPDIQPMAGLKIQYVGPSTQILVVNGATTQSITFTYLIFPQKSGTYEIGPFFVEHQGQMYKADSVTLITNDVPSPQTQTTSPQAPAPPLPTSVSATNLPEEGGSAPYSSDRVFLTMDIDKRKLYLNEDAILTIKLYVYDAGLKDIEYPVFSYDGFSAGELEEPQREREFVRGTSYDVLVFRQKLIGIKEGNYVLGPARLACKLMIRREITRRPSYFKVSLGNFGDDDFFSRNFSGYQTFPIELETEGIPVTILPLPEEGRPSDFQGAVGDFKMDAYIDPQKVKRGDPVQLHTIISGHGDFSTVTAPRLPATEDFKVYEPQVTKEGDRKLYEQILIPKSEEVKEVPPVSFSFFNPATRKYETAQKGPFKVEVTKRPESEQAVKMVTMPGMAQVFYPREELGQDIVNIKEEMGKLRPENHFLYKSTLFWILQLVPLALFMGFYSTYTKRERILHDKGYERLLKAPRKARKGLAKAKEYLSKDDAGVFYDVIFKTLQQYLGDRFNLPMGNVTIQVIEERLRPAGCEEEVLKDLNDIFSKCEIARYASSLPLGHEAEEVLEKVKRIIGYIERIKL